MKPAPIPWIVCLPGLQRLAGAALGNHRADGRLDRHDLHARLARLEHLADAGDRAAGADAGHEDINLPGRIPPDLLGRGAAMDFRIGRVLELLGDEIATVALRPNLRPAARAPVMPSAAGVRMSFGAQRFQQPAALQAHALGHRHLQFVAARRADKCQARCPCCRWWVR